MGCERGEGGRETGLVGDSRVADCGVARWIGLCSGEKPPSKPGEGAEAAEDGTELDEEECCRACCGSGGTGGAFSEEKRVCLLEEEGEGEREAVGEDLFSGIAGIASETPAPFSLLGPSTSPDEVERDNHPKALLRLPARVEPVPLAEVILMLSVLLRLRRLAGRF